MTSNSARLLELVHDARLSGASFDERPDSVVLHLKLPSEEAQAAWIELAENPPPPFGSVLVYAPGIGGELTKGDAYDADREVVVSIEKPTSNASACFLLQSSVRPFLSQHFQWAQVSILDLKITQEFRTRRLAVKTWDVDKDGATLPPPATIPIDPTKYVRDFVPQREVVSDLNPWMLLSPPSERSEIFQDWEAVAARRLLAGLMSRVWTEDNRVWMQAAGPPIYRIPADDDTLPAARLPLTSAAEWVYLSGSDVEARHLLFSSELARAPQPNQNLSTTLERALEAAKAAYEAHVQSASRETIKALADLRKTVIDETQKVTQRTQDLTATLWRDLAISAAPFFLKILTDAGKAANPEVSALFYFGAAAFIALSYALQWRINQAYLQSQKVSRGHWMQTLYSHISLKEREEIAEAPIDSAIRSYKETRCILLCVYLVLVIFLCSAGVYTLKNAAPPQQTQQSQSPTQKP